MQFVAPRGDLNPLMLAIFVKQRQVDSPLPRKPLTHSDDREMMTIIPMNKAKALLVLALVFTSSFASAQTADPIDFGRQIQPILAKRCFSCHGPDKAEAGLRLNQKDSVQVQLASNKSAIVPKQLEQS